MFPDSDPLMTSRPFGFIFGIHTEIFGSDFQGFFGLFFNPNVASLHQSEV